jgi:alanine dehydrogenase
MEAVPFITSTDLRALLPMEELISAVEARFAGQPGAIAAERTVLAGEKTDWIVMPGVRGGDAFLCKLVRVAHGPRLATERFPTVAGVVLLMNASGEVECILDAAEFTARRTAAAAGVATKLLAESDAATLALFGTGALALPHVEAIHAVRPLREIRIVGRTPERTDALVRHLTGSGHLARACDAQAALAGADIVVTVTTSATPVFDDSDLASHIHINAMGSYRPDHRELPAATLARATIVVESVEATWREAGDVILAHDEGAITRDHVHLELRDLIADQWRPGRGITIFKSVGHVLLDLAAADVVLERRTRGSAATRSSQAASGSGSSRRSTCSSSRQSC